MRWKNWACVPTTHKKSARIVGDVMGKYHPHGDSAIYDAMARMAQDFSTRYPLVDGQGNFGSIDGDSPAAMRYTEAKMSKLSFELLRTSTKKPLILPRTLMKVCRNHRCFPPVSPNLLVNGSSGIGLGWQRTFRPTISVR
jgi:DNA gyrase subunit A